jgi:phenylpropionate dioxygenase-like ring-hydroxylating dioxygenase large terminal subunit
MLTHEENDLLTKVGPGAPLGEMMRRYWHPIALSDQVPEPDGPPLRTKLLGQSFVVFRDTAGKVGVLDEFCMHRGVSLALARNEEGGLRCLYHGWKFATDGTILETPNHADCRLRERLKAPAYPVREQSGLIWTYIGPAEHQPPFRSFIFDTLPETHRTAFRANTKASWLPLWEGGLDSSHVAILHTNMLRPSWGATRRGESNAEPIAWDNLAPTYEIEDTEFGFQYCAFRELPDIKQVNARLTTAIMPYGRIIPGKGRGSFVMEVPMDDLETATYIVPFSTSEAPVDRAESMRTLGYDNPLYDPVTREFRLEWDNRLGQDRSIMGSNWSGFTGIELEDFAMSVSQAAWDRSKEHLVTSDLAVVRMRRMIMQAVSRFKDGEAPLGSPLEDLTKVNGYDLEIEAGATWQDFAPDNHKRVTAE